MVKDWNQDLVSYTYYDNIINNATATTYQLKEIVQSNQAPRLFFTNDSSLNSVIRNVNYNGINILFCENVTVFIQVIKAM